MSFLPRLPVTNPITSALTRIERARGFLEAAKLSEDWIRRMGARALVLEAHHTTHIEGTRLTLDQAKRLLSTLCLYRAGYDFKRLFTISEFYDRDRSAFYRAIQSVRERGMDLSGWLAYFTGGLATQLDEVKARGERAIRRDVLARRHRLSERQALALGHVLDEGRLTIQDLEAICPGVNRRTLQRDLKALVDNGLLAERGTGPTDPTRHFRLADALREHEKEL